MPTASIAAVTATPAAPAAAPPMAAAPTAAAAPLTPVASTIATGSVAALLTAQAQAGGVDPTLVKAGAWQESGWRMVTASDGGIGIRQLMPSTVTWIQTMIL